MEIRALSDAEIQDAENLFREIERRAETKETAVRHFPKAIRSSRFLGAYTADLAGFLAYTPDCFDIQYIGVRKEEAGKGVSLSAQGVRSCLCFDRSDLKKKALPLNRTEYFSSRWNTCWKDDGSDGMYMFPSNFRTAPTILYIRTRLSPATKELSRKV